MDATEYTKGFISDQAMWDTIQELGMQLIKKL